MLLTIDLARLTAIINRPSYSSIGFIEVMLTLGVGFALAILAYIIANKCDHRDPMLVGFTTGVMTLVICYSVITCNSFTLSTYSKDTKDAINIMMEDSKLKGEYVVQDKGIEVLKCGATIVKSFNCTEVTLTDSKGEELTTLIPVEYRSMIDMGDKFLFHISTYTELNEVTGLKFNYIMKIKDTE